MELSDTNALSIQQLNVLTSFSHALAQESSNLSQHPELLWQQVYNRLQWKENLVKEALRLEFIKRSKYHSKAWFHRLSKPQENEAFQFSLSGHSDQVNHAQFSPNGKLIATSSDDGTVRIWDAENGKEIQKILITPYKMKSAIFSKDSKKILMLAEGLEEFETKKTFYSRAFVWDVISAKMCFEIGAENKWVKEAIFSPDCNFIATIEDKYSKDEIFYLDDDQKKELLSLSEVRIWNAETGQIIQVISENVGEVTAVSFNHDGSIIATSCIGDIDEGEEPTGKWIMTGVNQQSPEYRKYRIVKESAFRLWSTQTGKDILTLEEHKDGMNNFVMSPDGTKILTSGVGPSAILWDIKTEKKLIAIEDFIGKPLFSPDSKYIVSNERDKIGLWDAISGKKLRTIEGHEEWAWDSAYSISGRSIEILNVAFDPTGNKIITCANDNTARIWDISTGEELLKLSGHTQPVLSAEFSPNGNRIITASFDKTAKVWRIIDDTQPDQLIGHLGSVNSVVFSPKGEKLVSSGDDRTICLWNPNTCELISKFGFVEDAVILYDRIIFSPDGNRIVSPQIGGYYPKVWNLNDQFPEFNLKHEYNVLAFDYSSNGKYLVTGSNDFNAYVWDAEKGRKLFTLKGHKSHVRAAVFDPSSNYIVTGSSDQSIRIWNVSNGKLVKRLKTQTGSVNMIIFNSDGTRFAVDDADKTVVIWDFIRKIPMFTLKGNASHIRYIQFSKNGKFIASLYDDGRVIISEIPLDKKEKSIFTRNKTEELKILKSFNATRFKKFNQAGQLNPVEFNSPGIISFSEKGDHLFAICDDGFFRTWHIATGKEIAMIPLLSATKFDISPNKPLIAIGDEGARLHFLELVGTSIY